MTDIATVYDPVKGTFDWAMDGVQLAQDDSLMTAIILSLFTDKRADPGDVLPDDAVGPFGNGKRGSGDRRGWWGDFMTAAALKLQPGASYPKPTDRIGSKFWLLRRRKMTAGLPAEIQGYASDALAWLKDDGIAQSITVSATKYDHQTILLTGSVVPVTGSPAAFTFPLQVGQL